MGVDRRQDSRFASDKDLVQRTARQNLRFVLTNQRFLLKARNGKEMLEAAKGMSKQTEPLRPNQTSYIDGMYEAVMKGMGLPSVGLHVSRKKRGCGL